MKVIFLDNIKGVGQIGDMKNVADGYARNFLLPRNLAKQASKSSPKEIELLKNKKLANETILQERANIIAEQIKDMVIEISKEANEEGHLYGSVNVEEIIQSLKTKGVKAKEEEVVLDKPIKNIGEYEINLDIHPQVKTAFKLKIVPAF